MGDSDDEFDIDDMPGGLGGEIVPGMDAVDVFGNPVPERLHNIPILKQRNYNPDMDLLVPEVLHRETTVRIFRETRIMTRAKNTLILIYGFITNAVGHEQHIVANAAANENTVHYNSNFGKVTYRNYQFPTPPPKTNRGRKSRQPDAKPRRKQGTGDDMSSQVCIWVRNPACSPVDLEDAPPSFFAEMDPALIEEFRQTGQKVIPRDTHVYKFKVFRTGDLQLPGATQHTLHNVIECGHIVVDTLNRILTPENPAKLVYMIPTLKNYSLVIKVPPKHVMNLTRLKACAMAVQRLESDTVMILNDERETIIRSTVLGEDPSKAPPHPKIKHVTYTAQVTKLTITFFTPVPGDPRKILQFNIFVDGPVTITGGRDTEMVSQACEFINWLIRTNYFAVISRVGYRERAPNIGDHDIPDIVTRTRTTEEIMKKYAYLGEEVAAACVRLEQ